MLNKARDTRALSVPWLVVALWRRRTLCLTGRGNSLPRPGERRTAAPKHEV